MVVGQNVDGQNVDGQNVDRQNVDRTKCRKDKMSKGQNVEKCRSVVTQFQLRHTLATPPYDIF